MQINLTPEQYEILIKLVYLGNWVVNGALTPDERLPDFDEVEELVYAQAGGLAEEMGLVRDEKGRFFPSAALEDELMEFIDDYEEDCFWDHLSQRLAYRDLVEELGEEAVEMMPPNERAEALYRHEERYDREFEESGLEDLRLVKIKI
ncbi:MAG: hypothetical protein K6U03_05905 [Firmicutes bacterium]|nr:hypothetical protein [Bacillota bacterium]